MPFRVIRKILSDKGHITIPKTYRDFFHLKKGDELVVFGDTILLIVPKNEEERMEECFKTLIDQLKNNKKKEESL